MSEELSLDKDTFTGAASYLALEASLPTETKSEDMNLSAESIEAIATKFRYRTEVDQDGLTRQIYEREGVSFSFAGREETPIYPTVEQSKPTHLGHESWWLNFEENKEAPIMPEHVKAYYRETGMSEDNISELDAKEIAEWQTEHTRLTSYDDTLAELRTKNVDNPEHFVAEQSPYGVYLLMAKLHPENSHWQQQADNIAQNKYDQEAIQLIDSVTAVNALYQSLRSDADEMPPLGEVVAMAAKEGDVAAQRIINQALKKQTEQEEAAIEDAKVTTQKYAEQYPDVEGYKPEDLLVVHVTRYAPKLEADGYKVQTTHDASGFPRASVHTSLNHTVDSHMWGEWDDKDYVVISGLDKMLDANGSPKSLNGADTWWTRSPGEPLTFPDATLVMPGGNQSELVTRGENGELRYKSQGYTQEDVLSANETLFYGATSLIERSLVDEDGNPIVLESTQAQGIIANILRSAAVRQEITQQRGKQILQQTDDKFMSSDVNKKVYKMAADLELPLTSALHAESEESHTEHDVSRSKPRYTGISDPNVRRVAYASGFMRGGGIARQEALRYEDENLPSF